MDLLQIFENCKSMYLDIINDIGKMASCIAASMRAEGKEFDPEVTVMKFDLILQYSLLQTACSDFDLARAEIEFIKELTVYADFCDYMSNAYGNGSKMTWEDLYNADVNDVRALLSAHENGIRELSDEVVSVFAIYDKAADHNYFADLTDNIFGIVSGLAFMDGDENSEDLRQRIFIFEFLDKIEELLGQ